MNGSVIRKRADDSTFPISKSIDEDKGLSKKGVAKLYNVENGEPLPSEITELCAILSRILYRCLVGDVRRVNDDPISGADIKSSEGGNEHEQSG